MGLLKKKSGFSSRPFFSFIPDLFCFCTTFFSAFLDVTLRGVGQVVFCNNPITGLVIMIALASAHVPIAAPGREGEKNARKTAEMFRSRQKK
jgi:hypothetical protein